jgi:uracil-DNA glycosylase family 4
MTDETYVNIRALSSEITSCINCPRLVQHRELIARIRRRSFMAEKYWGKPVSGFGDPLGRLLIVGLAPAAHGANRTGRVFTGDQSARFLMRGLKAAGFANQSHSEHLHDGLQLHDTYITCAVKCVPPDNKPTSQERQQCQHYLEREIAALCNIKIVLTLGRLAFSAYYAATVGTDKSQKEPRFTHGKRYIFAPNQPSIYGSYHPSPRNTNTGLLTQSSFEKVLSDIRAELDASLPKSS